MHRREVAARVELKVWQNKAPDESVSIPFDGVPAAALIPTRRPADEIDGIVQRDFRQGDTTTNMVVRFANPGVIDPSLPVDAEGWTASQHARVDRDRGIKRDVDAVG